MAADPENGEIRKTLLFTQYKFAEDYAAQLRTSIQNAISRLAAFLLVTVPLQFVEFDKVFGAPAYVFGIVMLSLAAGILVTNVLITVYVFNSFMNDVNALRIERELGHLDVGLWHNWYGMTMRGRAPVRTLASGYYGLRRSTSFHFASAWFTLAASAVLLMAAFRAASFTFPLGASVLLAVSAGAANLLLQRGIMRGLVRSSSPEFQAFFKEFGFT